MPWIESAANRSTARAAVKPPVDRAWRKPSGSDSSCSRRRPNSKAR